MKSTVRYRGGNSVSEQTVSRVRPKAFPIRWVRRDASGNRVMGASPIELLRQFRSAFELEAKALRRQAPEAEPQRASELRMRALAAETAVRKIDATLKDWA